jgi:uncharacterized membrane protein YfhO
LYLYTLDGSRGRVSLDPPDAGSATVTESVPERIAIDVDTTTDADLILTDLAYPGWTVTVDGEPAQWTTVDGMYRSVPVPAGEHTVVWTYAPQSLRIGVAISVVTALLLCGAIRHAVGTR